MVIINPIRGFPVALSEPSINVRHKSSASNHVCDWPPLPTVLLSRSEPSCVEHLDTPVLHSEIVSVPLPADAGEEKKVHAAHVASALSI